MDRQLACCASGIVDASGTCCPAGAVLDAAGACCAGGKLDACGVCGGDGQFVDTAGACCATLLDADGQCCASGAVDECGVCNGMGTSCAIDMNLQLTVSPELVYGDAVQVRRLPRLCCGVQLWEGWCSCRPVIMPSAWFSRPVFANPAVHPPLRPPPALLRRSLLSTPSWAT